MRVAFPDLHPAMAEKELLRGNEQAIAFESSTWNKEVCYSSFVLKRDKAVSFCGAGPLSADNDSCTAGMLTV